MVKESAEHWQLEEKLRNGSMKKKVLKGDLKVSNLGTKTTGNINKEKNDERKTWIERVLITQVFTPNAAMKTHERKIEKKKYTKKLPESDYLQYANSIDWEE